MVNGPEELPPEVDLDAVDWDWVDWSACGREVRRLRQNRPSGLLEPYAATSGTYGSEGDRRGNPPVPQACHFASVIANNLSIGNPQVASSTTACYGVNCHAARCTDADGAFISSWIWSLIAFHDTAAG